MEPTNPTLGDKVKAAVKGVVPPAMGGTAGTGIPTRVTAEEEALAKGHVGARGAGLGGAGATTAGLGAGTTAGMGGAGGFGAQGTTATGHHHGGGGIAGGFERGVERAEAAVERGVERVLHRAEGTVMEDRPIVKEVRQQFVEHRPVAQQVETVTRIVGETAVEGGVRLEPVGPATERVVREGDVASTAAAGEGARGGLGGATTAGITEEERLAAERLGGGRGRGTI